jgi:hypothetical protein
MNKSFHSSINENNVQDLRITIDEELLRNIVRSTILAVIITDLFAHYKQKPHTPILKDNND